MSFGKKLNALNWEEKTTEKNYNINLIIYSLDGNFNFLKCLKHFQLLPRFLLK